MAFQIAIQRFEHHTSTPHITRQRHPLYNSNPNLSLKEQTPRFAGMADDDNLGWTLSDSPFAYAIFPFVFLVIIIFAGSVLYSRRRRRRMALLQGGQWPQDYRSSQTGAHQHAHRNRGTGNRWAPWSGTRTEEGLNELGEAPPPYDPKREGDGRPGQYELRDLERNSPPDYPAEPGPAVTRNSQPRAY